MSACLDERQLCRDAFRNALSHDERVEACQRLAGLFGSRREWSCFHDSSYRYAKDHGIIERRTAKLLITVTDMAQARDQIHDYAMRKRLDYFTEYRMADQFKKLAPEFGVIEALRIVFNQAQGGQK